MAAKKKRVVGFHMGVVFAPHKKDAMKIAQNMFGVGKNTYITLEYTGIKQGLKRQYRVIIHREM